MEGSCFLKICTIVSSRKKATRKHFGKAINLKTLWRKRTAFVKLATLFKKNEIVYKKISGKKWFAEILIPDDDEFEIGCELTIDNYIYKKIGETWTIEKIN